MASSSNPWKVENDWALEGIDGEEDSGSEAEFDYQNVTAEEAEQHLFDFTVGLKRKGTLIVHGAVLRTFYVIYSFWVHDES